MEIVLGQQIADPAVAFGSLTTKDETIPINHQQILKSNNNNKVEIDKNKDSSLASSINNELPKFLQGAPSEAIDAVYKFLYIII